MPGELKRETPSEAQRQNENLRWNLKTPWIRESFGA
jgi:hypothetical protein